ncbi:MAG: GNAT family N-acetyltransferase [Pseudomonadota bacterium]
MDHPLDKPFWSALVGVQANLASGSGRARRYLPDVSAIGGVADASDGALADLAKLVPKDGALTVPQAFAIGCPAGATQEVMMAWQLLDSNDGPQATPSAEILPLSEPDWPAMMALATLTQPGPFMLRTPLMGHYWGVKRDGVLIAMAGERMRLEDYVEISAICTHPDYRGAGLGTALCLHVRDAIRARGQTPFLHAYQSNTGAIQLYESLGFVKRTEIYANHFSAAD